MSGFLWNQEVRRKMGKGVADVMEVRNGLLAIALVYPNGEQFLARKSDNPLSPVVWSIHNFVFHKSPKSMVLT